MSGRRCAAWLVVAACAAAPAAAHDRTVSYSSWDIDGPHARVAARLTALDVSRLPWGTTAGAELEHRLGDYLTERLTLRADGQPCPVSRAPTRLATTTDHIEVAWEVTCPSPHALQLHSEVLLDVSKVAIVPGEAFGAPGYARLSFALGDDDLGEGVRRIAAALGG